MATGASEVQSEEALFRCCCLGLDIFEHRGATAQGRRTQKASAWPSVEACGTGSGFLHHDPDPEIAHFRSSIRVYKWTTVIGQVEPMVGIGFAELQVGEDSSGFDFFGVGPRGVETAGPEAALTLRSLYSLKAGLELMGSATLGLIYAPHGPRLVVPQPAALPFATFTLGFGF